MRLKYILHNVYNDIKRFLKYHDHIIVPIIVAGLYAWLLYFTNVIVIDKSFISNLITICPVYTGFLLTVHTLIMTFPDSQKFVQLLKQYGYFKKLFIELALAEACLGACLIFCLFGLSDNIASILFVLGVTFTGLMGKLFITMSFYVSK